MWGRSGYLQDNEKSNRNRTLNKLSPAHIHIHTQNNIEKHRETLYWRELFSESGLDLEQYHAYLTLEIKFMIL